MSSAPRAPTAAALVIGNELLSGKVHEGNLIVLAKALRPLGVRLSRVVMIEDDPATIVDEVRALSPRYDWLFTSGGVGPTHDDVTLEAVARAFDQPIVRHADLARLLKHFYGERCTEGHLHMADVPRDVEMVGEHEGPVDWDAVAARAAPWPTMLVKNTFVLPGIPQVFQMKLPAIIARLKRLGAAPYVSRAVLTNMDEGHLKPLLDRAVAAFPDVEIGSYPAWYGAPYKTKLTFDGRDGARVLQAADAFAATLPEGEVLSRE